MNKLLVVCGPTATGKTSIALSLAKKFNGELICADSRQIYKGMDIGTDMYSAEEYGIKQFMTDIFEPDHNLSVVEFVRKCRDIIQRNFFTSNKIPQLLQNNKIGIAP